MLNVLIEKEIIQKHGVIKGKDWDIRQTICIGAAIACTGLSWWIFKLDMAGICIVGVICTAIAYFAGWYNKAGLNIEELAIKYFQRSLYKNRRRSYHTRNGYVDLLNGAYGKMRKADLSDKRTAKMVENREKREKAKKRISKYKSYL